MTHLIKTDTYLARYRDGERRGDVFAAMIADTALALRRQLGRELTLLDIGCGQGFDENTDHQAKIAALGQRIVGVEPDRGVAVGPFFSEVHRTIFEDAAIAPGAIDLAFSFMVLEHVADPERFWSKLKTVLAPGGVFIGVTPDARHPFCAISKTMEQLRLKDWWMRRRGGTDQFAKYLHYPTHYRANTPQAIARRARGFAGVRCANFSRPGVLNYYLPGWLHALAEWIDRRMIAWSLPGTILVVEITR